MKIITRTITLYAYKFVLLDNVNGNHVNILDTKVFDSYTKLTDRQQRALKKEHNIESYVLADVSVKQGLYGCTLDEFMSVAKEITKEGNKDE